MQNSKVQVLETDCEAADSGNRYTSASCIYGREVRWWVARLWENKAYLFIVAYPIILSSILFVYDTPEAYGAYLLLLMAGFFVTEVIPIYVTSFLPVVIAPLMGLVRSDDICKEYMRDATMLFLGGILLATTIEYRQLHKRIAINILRLVGTEHKMLMLGFMLSTWFLSMWMSNTAATAMMVTIVDVIVERLKNVHEQATTLSRTTTSCDFIEFASGPSTSTSNDKKSASKPFKEASGNCGVSKSSGPKEGEAETMYTELSNVKKELTRFKVGLSLSICYSASCGGIATLTGTGTNIIFYGMVVSYYGSSTSLNFGSWMMYALPISLITLIFTWVWLCIIYIGPKSLYRCKPCRANGEETPFDRIVNDEWRALGKLTYPEIMCIFIFTLIILLWITREPGVSGWSTLFRETTGANGKVKHYVTDTQPAILVAIIAMILPARNPFRKNKPDVQGEDESEKDKFLLPWKVVQQKCPWGIVLILGGGFALAMVCKESGLSDLVGRQLQVLKSVPDIALVYLCSQVAALVTEVTSNSATATILIPIGFSLAQYRHIHPFLIAMPMTVATSFAFCLPAATPPNAIVFGRGGIKVKDMIKTGICLNVVGVLIVLICTVTYGIFLFDLMEYPSWANFTQPITP